MELRYLQSGRRGLCVAIAVALLGTFAISGTATASGMAVLAASTADTPASAAQPGDNGAAQATQDPAASSDQASSGKTKASKARSQAQATQLATVVVTSNRRAETLQNVAAPVSVLTYQDIQRQHLQSFADYVVQVPGFNYVTIGAGRTELALRGISSGSVQPSGSVGIYIDDSPFGSSSVYAQGSLLTPDLDPADLERIEVLRGPQGTLYGAGALGGVLRYITIAPDTENLAGRVQLDGSSVDGGGTGFGGHGMVNLPLIADKLALRASVYDRTDPGFISDAGRGKTDVNESRVKGGRAALLWTPTDKTSLQITALAQNVNSDGNPVEALDPVTHAPVYGDLQQRIGAGTGTFDARYRLYNATLNSDFGWAKLVASSSYSTLDAVENDDVTPLLPLGPPYGIGELQPIRQTKATQELRLQSPKSDRLEWLLGVFTTHETGSLLQDIYSFDYATGAPLPSPFGIPIGNTSQPSTYDEYAVYGSLTWHLNDQFDVEAGLRYSHDRQHYTLTQSGAITGSATPVVNDTHSADSSTTFSLTPRFHINDSTLLYARIASGFLPGGPNAVPLTVPGVSPTFSPTKLTDYELGLKSTSLDDRLMVDLSAFYIDWTKIPLTTFVSPYTFLSAGGQAKSRGLEATVDFIPIRGLKLSLNAAYTDPTLSAAAPPPSNGVKGDRLPYSPKWNLSLNGDYDFSLGGDWNGFVGASYVFVGTRKSDFTFTGTARTNVPAYHTVNLRAGVTHGQWEISGYVKNATNERGIVLDGTAELNPITGQMEDNVTIITPRLIGISVSRNF